MKALKGIYMKKWFLLVLLILLPAAIFAQGVSKVGTTAAAFLEIGPGAAAIGTGGAFTGRANDATSLYWNAAGIAGFYQNELDVVHTNWIAETSYNYAALVIPMGNAGSLGLSFTSLATGDMKVTTVEMPEGTGEYFNASDIAIGLSYGRKLTERFSIGFTAKFIQQKIWHMNANAFAIDAGTLFKTDLLGGMSIGASISNFGSQLTLSGRDARKYGRVDDTKLGSNERIPYDVELDSWDLPMIFRIGVSTDAVKTKDFRFTVSVDALHPNNNYESMNAGGELSYLETLFIRGGYNSLFLKDSEGGLSFGVGINTKMLFSDAVFRFDYSFRDFGRLSNIHTFSAGIIF
jgi:hypothetical protein